MKLLVFILGLFCASEALRSNSTSNNTLGRCHMSNKVTVRGNRGHLCGFCSGQSTILNFQKNRIKVNNLGGLGPTGGQQAIWWTRVGDLGGKSLDLIMTAVGNAYHRANIRYRRWRRTGRWFARRFHGSIRRGVGSAGSMKAGRYVFQYRFVYTNNRRPAKIHYLPLTFYDLDGGKEFVRTYDAVGVAVAKPTGMTSYGCRRQGSRYFCWANAARREYRFPRNFDRLSRYEKMASVTFLFRHRSSFKMIYRTSFDHRIFMFKGSAALMCRGGSTRRRARKPVRRNQRRRHRRRGRRLCARLYQHSNFRGRVYNVYGNVRFLRGFNDQLSSMRVYNCHVRLYQHSNYRGRSHGYNRGNYNYHNIRRTIGNDKVSSVRVWHRNNRRRNQRRRHRRRGRRLCARLYQHSNFRGRVYNVYGNVRFLRGFNDQLSSMRVYNCHVRLYQHSNYRGRSHGYNRGNYNYHNIRRTIGNDQVSSVRVWHRNNQRRRRARRNIRRRRNQRRRRGAVCGTSAVRPRCHGAGCQYRKTYNHGGCR